MTDRRPVDRGLLLAAAALCAIGAIMVFSASSAVAYTQFGDSTYFLKRELLWLALGGAACFIGARMDYGRLRGIAPWLLAISIVLLVLVLVPHVGAVRGGAQRWFFFGAQSFEPSEFAKLAVVIWLAALFSSREDGARSFRSAGFPALLVTGACFYLVVREPDLGTACLFLVTAFTMLFIAGARLRQLAVAAAVAIPAVVAFIYSSAYRRARFTAFLDPWRDPKITGYHIIHSLYALGSGGLLGLGLGQGHLKFGYLPEQYTDFIFAVIGEELGFVGTAAVLALFVYLAYRGVRIALRADDRFGFYLACGVTAAIAAQALINIAVVTSSFPVTGVPLPFISYGGTSLVISLFGVGLLASVSRGRPRAALAAEARAEEGADAHHARRRRHGRSYVPRAVTSPSALRRAR